MEIHMCRDCCTISEIIGKEVKKCNVLSKENLKLHINLAKSRSTITDLNLKMDLVRDALIAERDRNLQLYLQQHTNSLKHFTLNRGSEYKNIPTRKTAVGLASSSTKDTTDFVTFVKYNELKNLIQQQKQLYEADLSLIQSLAADTVLKLKEQITNVATDNLDILNIYQITQTDLIEQKNANLELREQFQNSVDKIERVHDKHVENIKVKMYAEATKTANDRVKEALQDLKFQLEQRDNLVHILRRQQTSIETYGKRQIQEKDRQQHQYKDQIEELKKQLKTARLQYAVLDKRRALEGEGFLTDITNIRKDLKKLKKSIPPTAGAKSLFEVESERLRKELNAIHVQLDKCYFTRN